MTSVVTEPFSGQLVTLGGHCVIVYTLVVYTVLVVRGTDVVVGADFSVSVTGQMVVYHGTTSVVTCGPAGQLVTVGAHEVTVRVIVLDTVLVVICTDEVVEGMMLLEPEG